MQVLTVISVYNLLWRSYS